MIKSPFTGKEMTIKVETITTEFRGESFEVAFHTYFCQETNQSFEDEVFAKVNTDQLYNQYRVKHDILFPKEIQEIRKKYQVTASTMGKILGFGPEDYDNYELGQVLSLEHNTLIKSIRDLNLFKEYVKKANIRLAIKKALLLIKEE